MKFYAVIDTNVLVSYLLTRRNDSSVALVMELVKEGTIIPLLHAEIIKEYQEVLNRDKLKIDPTSILDAMNTITSMGLFCDRKETTYQYNKQ